MRKHFTILLAIASLLPLSQSLASARIPQPSPNVLIIYADDLGYGDLGCYNPESGKIPTPHMDRLAAEGMRFTDAHASSAVCTPSRYTLLTGQYHWRSRLQDGIIGLWEEPLITPDRLTIGGLAQQNGYQTAFIGKWHLGWDWPISQEELPLFKTKGRGRDNADLNANATQKSAWSKAFSQPIGGGPIELGFDSYFGTDVPNWPPYCFIEDDRTVGIPSEYGDPVLFERHMANKQGPAVEGWRLEPILPTLKDRVVDYIDQRAKSPEPFLLVFSLTSPHTPLSVNDEWKGASGLNPYADFVMETDAVVGQVLDALEKSGAAKNTLVLLSSDNGCAPYIGVNDLESMGHFPSGPLRGYKSDVWEGGHRVPFIVRWPSVVEPGTVNDQLVHQADLMATLADVMGAKLPSNAGEDSFSILPLLKGSNEPVRMHAVSASIRGVPSLRHGSWKYIPAPGSGGWSDDENPTQAVQLYNLAEDIDESKNLAADQPERVAQMQAVLDDLIARGSSRF